MECVPAPACCYWIVSFSYYHVLSTEGKSSKNVHRKIMENYVSPCKVTMSKKVKWDIKYNLSRLYDTVSNNFCPILPQRGFLPCQNTHFFKEKLEWVLASHQSTAMKNNNIDEHSPFPPSVTVYISVCLVLLFLFIGVPFSVLFNLHTKFKAEAAADLLAMQIQFTNWTVVLRSHVAEFQFWCFHVIFRVQERQCHAQKAINGRKSDPEKFLLNVKMKWARANFLNSCFQCLLLLGVDIPKLIDLDWAGGCSDYLS